MIISTDKKIAVFMVPKTGSNTLRLAFKSSGLPLKLCDDSHYDYGTLKHLVDDNPLDYRCFGFVRDPLSRCISTLNFLRRGRQGCKFIHAMYGNEYPVSCASRAPYSEWDDERKALVDRVPMIEVFRRMKWFFERNIYGTSHKIFLDGPVELLNFHDYNNELAKLFTIFGVEDPKTIPVPHVNGSLTIPEFDYLSPQEEAEIRDYFSEDYDFLASKGIRFS